MRPLPLFLALAAAVLLTACASTPDTRIAADRAAFARYPSAAQEKIRAGDVAVGFTPEMVRLALGEPDRISTRKTAQGDTEVWSYRDGGPRFSFGVGVGSYGRRSATQVGVGTAAGDRDPEDKLQVEFRAGRVVAFESRRR